MLRKILIVVAGAGLVLTCSDKGTDPKVDKIPPSRIESLQLQYRTDSTAAVTWLAPGDDGTEGEATAYDLRYSETTLTEETWDSARIVSGLPVPGAPGTSQDVVVEGLNPETGYYFAIKAVDEAGNWSAMSDAVVVLAHTSMSPPSISDLRVDSVEVNSALLKWTVPYDSTAGPVSAYDIRYSTDSLSADNWNAAIQIENEPAPGLAGQTDSLWVHGLDMGHDWFFGIVAISADGILSELSNPARGSYRGILRMATHGGTGYDEATKVVATSDAGFVVAGKTTSTGAGGTDAYIVKFDADFEVVWEHTYGGASSDYAVDIDATSGGDILVLVHSESLGGGITGFIVISLSNVGTQLWQVTYQDSREVGPTSIAATSDGCFAVSGRLGGKYDDDRAPLVVKFGSDRQVAWADTIYHWSADGETWGSANCVINTLDDRLAISWGASYCCGTDDHSDPPGRCACFAGAANITFFNYTGTAGETYALGQSWEEAGLDEAIQCMDGGFLASTYYLGGSWHGLEKVDSDGELRWTVSATPVEDLVQVGSSRYVYVGTYNLRGTVKAVSANGGHLSTVTLTDDVISTAYGVDVLADGSIIVVGGIDVPGNDRDILVVKLHPEF